MRISRGATLAVVLLGALSGLPPVHADGGPGAPGASGVPGAPISPAWSTYDCATPQVSLTWYVPAGQPAGTTYTVTGSPSGTTYVVAAPHNVTTFTPADDDTSYAVTATADGAASAAVTATEGPAVTCGAPEPPVDPTVADCKWLMVSWSAPDDNGSQITSYTAVAATDGDDSATVGGSTTSAELDTPAAGSDEAFVVAANAVGTSAPADAQTTVDACDEYPRKKVTLQIAGMRHYRVGARAAFLVRRTAGARGTLISRISGPRGFDRTWSNDSFRTQPLTAPGTYRVVARFAGAAPSATTAGWASAVARLRFVVRPRPAR